MTPQSVDMKRGNLMRHDLTLIDVKRVADELVAQYPDDAELLADMLEGCTDLHELCSRLVARIEDERGNQSALKEQIDSRNIRKKKSSDREKSMRRSIIDLMNAARQTKLVLPEATLSKTTRKPALTVTDVDALPDEYVTIETKRNPDLKAIKATDTPIPGTQMDNGGEGLTVRMK